jgi:hypothetical protein
MCGTYSRSRHYRCSRYWHKDDRQTCPNGVTGVSANIAERLTWDWLVGLLTDEEKLVQGIRAMQARGEAENDPKRDRLAAVIGLADKAAVKVKRLAAELANCDDDIVMDALRAELKLAAKQVASYNEERERLEGELQRIVITPQVESSILAIAEKIRRRLCNATDEQKGELLNLLGVRVEFRRAEDGRSLDVSCRIKPGVDVIALDALSRTQHNYIAFSISIPLDGQATTLADELFGSAMRSAAVV